VNAKEREWHRPRLQKGVGQEDERWCLRVYFIGDSAKLWSQLLVTGTTIISHRDGRLLHLASMLFALVYFLLAFSAFCVKDSLHESCMSLPPLSSTGVI
jgi:hypothetical protein